MEWFYFSNNGKPKAADSDRLDTQDLTRINGKTYLFNEKGNPVYGLRKVYTGSGEDDWTAYYLEARARAACRRER